MKRKINSMPTIGMRIIKSSVGVFLGFVVYFLRGNQGTPFYTALSVLWCMQPYSNDSKSKAVQRIIGTIIGAIYGSIIIVLEYYFIDLHNEIIRNLLISLFIILVIYTTVIFNKKNASYFSCVVFLSIVVVHITDENPALFVLNRVLDTITGIIIALVINYIRIPRKKRKNVLFVSELDSVLLTTKENLTNYSKFQLNKMLDEGANFTIATMRSPAALLEALDGIRLRLPVVLMDGAMMFDIKEKRCMKLYEMSNKEAMEFINIFKSKNFHCFINVVVEDSVMIYYGEFKNEVERDIYNKLRVSPYRNYIKGELPENCRVVYLMLIDTKSKIDQLYNYLEKNNYTKDYKILKYDSEDYEGYTYIKIYNKMAAKKNMINEIKEMIKAEEIITFGNIEGVSDAVIEGKDGNEIVKKFNKVYEPYFWKRNVL